MNFFATTSDRPCRWRVPAKGGFMRLATGLSAVIALSSFASAEAPKNAAPSPPPSPAPTGALSESAKLLAPIQVESLTLTPIVTTKQKLEQDNLLVLDEAMGKKLVRIHEVANEDVNNL